MYFQVCPNCPIAWSQNLDRSYKLPGVKVFQQQQDQVGLVFGKTDI